MSHQYNQTLQTNNSSLEIIRQKLANLPEAGNGGTNTSDATAVAEDIMLGQTAYIASGKTTGTFTIEDELTTITQQITNIQSALSNKTGANPKLQEKSVTPSETAQSVTPDSTYQGLSKVNVGAIPSTYVKPSTTKGATTYTPSTTNQTISAGTYCTGIQTIQGDPDLLASNIRKGANIFGVDGSYEGTTGIDTSDATATTGDIISGKTAYVKGSKITGTIQTKSSTDLTVSGATVTVPAGYYASQASKSVTTGSAKTPATTVTKNPTISVNSSGLITASVSGTQSVTPTVTAGYVSSGTAGTITVSGSATKQLTTQAAKTITPSTSSQTAVASGVYTTGTITVGAIPSQYEDVTTETNQYTSLLTQLETVINQLPDAGSGGGSGGAPFTYEIIFPEDIEISELENGYYSVFGHYFVLSADSFTIRINFNVIRKCDICIQGYFPGDVYMPLEIDGAPVYIGYCDSYETHIDSTPGAVIYQDVEPGTHYIDIEIPMETPGTGFRVTPYNEITSVVTAAMNTKTLMGKFVDRYTAYLYGQYLNYDTRLTGIEYKNVTDVYDNIFPCSEFLKTVRLPNCTNIGIYAFQSINETSIQEVHIGTSGVSKTCSIAALGFGSVIGVGHVQQLYIYYSEVALIDSINVVDWGTDVYVPENLLSAYRQDTNWCVIADRIHPIESQPGTDPT